MKQDLSKRDFYTKKAKEDNYPARSVYKIKELDEKFHLLKKVDRVLDLGCSPGSWLLYISRMIGERGAVVGVDEKELKITLPKNVYFIQKNIWQDDLLSEPLLQKKFQAVVSDLAPKTSGIKVKDGADSFELCQRALEIAQAVLKESGVFVCKMLEGKESQRFVDELKKSFHLVKKVKTKATIRNSREFYLVGKRYERGQTSLVLKKHL